MVSSTGQKYTPIFTKFSKHEIFGFNAQNTQVTSSNGPTGPESDDNFPLFSPEIWIGAFAKPGRFLLKTGVNS